jgi:hypothetical protein
LQHQPSLFSSEQTPSISQHVGSSPNGQIGFLVVGVVLDSTWLVAVFAAVAVAVFVAVVAVPVTVVVVGLGALAAVVVNVAAVETTFVVGSPVTASTAVRK